MSSVDIADDAQDKNDFRRLLQQLWWHGGGIWSQRSKEVSARVPAKDPPKGIPQTESGCTGGSTPGESIKGTLLVTNVFLHCLLTPVCSHAATYNVFKKIYCTLYRFSNLSMVIYYNVVPRCT